MNTVTPRLFVAATRQDEGKTTTCIGLYQALSKRFGAIGYIKPVGQRFIEVNGLRIDEDSFLMEQTYKVKVPLEDMSPITVGADFTKKFIEAPDTESLEKKIVKSFDRAAWEKDFVIVEGSGHAGVGSVFNLSNARVAALLQCPAIIVTRGGIGAPYDEVALNHALFEKEGVPVIGVVLNKVLPSKREALLEISKKSFARLGLKVLGVMPLQEELRHPTVSQIARTTKAEYLYGARLGVRRVHRIMVGAMASRNAISCIEPGTLLITPGDRDDLILASLIEVVLNKEQANVVGILLTGSEPPSENLMRLMQKIRTPILRTPLSTYEAAAEIQTMTVKTEANDGDKIQLIQQLIETHMDIDRLLQNVMVRTGKSLSVPA
jgi:BioD-like phosphotransacetylase family protein